MSTSINPSSLSFHSPSPEPSSSSNKRSVSPSESDSHSNAGSSRKRQRTDLSAEERKDARMHRNRIAAQNSRDRRKAHYAHLEQRVAELEEENRRLRAGMAVPSVLPHRSETEKVEEREREKAKERENEELRERIRTLEKGWEAVVKALAAQGLPTGLSTALSSTSSEPLPPSNIPTIVPTTPMFPISPPSTLASLTSSPSCFVPSPTGGDHRSNFDAPAAGGLDTNQLDLDISARDFHHQLNGTQFADPTSTTNSQSAVDEATMEDLLREILAASPTISSTSLPSDESISSSSPLTSPAQVPSTSTSSATQMINESHYMDEDWESESNKEMQRLILGMLPQVSSDIRVETVDFPSALNLELGGWDLENVLPPSQVGVF